MKSEKEMVLDYASELKMLAVRDIIDEINATAVKENWSYMRMLYEIMQREAQRRETVRIATHIKMARFPQLKYISELDIRELPKDARIVLPELETLDFIKEARNVVLYGNPGTGKTHIATALGIKACEHKFSVMFTSVPKLLVQIREARSAKTLGMLQARFEKYDLVICDEFGYVSCDKEAAEMLFNHLSLRAGKKATIITTNLAFNRWNEIIKDKVLVAAMVDRLTHKAFLVNMSGQSYRLKETQKIIRNKA